MFGIDDVAAAGIIGSGISAIGNFFGIGSANNANKELAKYNWDRQVEMWHMQNAYNAPTAQMQRYRDAGLNPNLIYGTGSSAGNSTSIPHGNVPTMQPYQLPDFGHAILQAAQVDNLREQNKSIQQDVVLKTLDSVNRMIKNNSDVFDFNLKKELRGNTIKLSDLAVDNATEDLRGKGLNNDFLDQSMEDRLGKTKQDFLNSEETFRLLEQQTGLTKKQIETETQKARTEVAKQYELRTAGRLNEQKAAEIKQQMDIVDATLPEILLKAKLGNLKDISQLTTDEINRLARVCEVQLKAQGLEFDREKFEKLLRQKKIEHAEKLVSGNIVGSLATTLYIMFNGYNIDQ